MVRFFILVSKAVVNACVPRGIIASFFIEMVGVVISPLWLYPSGKFGITTDAVAVVVLSAGFTF